MLFHPPTAAATIMNLHYQSLTEQNYLYKKIDQ